MAKKMQKIKTGWLVPDDILESFREDCARNSYVIQDACAAALTVWQHLPVGLQQLALWESKGLGPPQTEFWSQIAEGLEVGIFAQFQGQRSTVSKAPKRKRP